METFRSFGEKYLTAVRKHASNKSPSEEEKQALFKVASEFQEYMLEGIITASNFLSKDGVDDQERDGLAILINELTMFSMDALAVKNQCY